MKQFFQFRCKIIHTHIDRHRFLPIKMVTFTRSIYLWKYHCFEKSNFFSFNLLKHQYFRTTISSMKWYEKFTISRIKLNILKEKTLLHLSLKTDHCQLFFKNLYLPRRSPEEFLHLSVLLEHYLFERCGFSTNSSYVDV